MSSSVTIREMENVAMGMNSSGGPDLSLSGDIGNVINLNDMGDDLGLNMLANQSRINVNTERSSGHTVQVSSVSFADEKPKTQQSGGFSNYSGSSGAFPGLGEIDVSPLEPISLESSIPMAPVQVHINREESSGGNNLY
jgi:hypothetical protein